MNVLIWIVVGGLIGWFASKILTTDGQHGIALNVVIGIVGALIGGWVLSPMLGISSVNQNDISIPGLLVSLTGAIALLGIVKFLRTYNLRW
jgi:uncharacterized membrane protein YeaQ/YmgE (transglycosylase-associated protein family)